MNKENIKRILIAYRNRHHIALEDEILEAFAAYLAEKTSARPIPHFDEVLGEAAAGELFFKILNDLWRIQEDRKKNFEYLSKLIESVLLKIDLGEDFVKVKDFVQKFFKEIDSNKIFRFGDQRKLNRCSNQEELFSFLNGLQERVNHYNFNGIYEVFEKDLSKCILKIHSKYCLQSLNRAIEGSQEPVKFIHFYESPFSNLSKQSEDFRGKPRASEYLKAYNSSDDEEELRRVNFDKTSHGIGSGIYGVAQLSEEMIDEQVEERESQFCIIELKSPLCLIGEETDKYTEISKGLQWIANRVKDKQIENRSRGNKVTRVEAFNSILKEKEEELRSYAAIINSFSGVKPKKLLDEEMYAHLCATMLDFLREASSKEDKENKANRDEIVPMPINYLVKRLGFKGVVSWQNDVFNRGLIVMDFEEDPLLSNFAKIEVKSIGKKEISSAASKNKKEILTSNEPLPKNIAMGGSGFFSKRKDRLSSSNPIPSLSLIEHAL